MKTNSGAARVYVCSGCGRNDWTSLFHKDGVDHYADVGTVCGQWITLGEVPEGIYSDAGSAARALKASGERKPGESTMKANIIDYASAVCPECGEKIPDAYIWRGQILLPAHIRKSGDKCQASRQTFTAAATRAVPHDDFGRAALAA